MSPSAMPPSAPCDGKTVVITGAANGLGQAVAIAFVAAGADRIAIMDSFNSSFSETLERASAAAIEAGRPAPELSSLQLDMGDPASLENGVNQIHSRWGHVDVLINAISQVQPFETSDIDAWWKTWEMNVKEALVVARTLLPLLLNGTDKTIVHVIPPSSSPQSPSTSHYLSELAMMRLSEDLTLEHGNDGLLAYSLQPGSQEKQTQESDSVKRKVASETLVYLISERREWLAGRHVNCSEDMWGVISRNNHWDADDFLELGTSVNKMPVASGKTRGRVSRSSY